MDALKLCNAAIDMYNRVSQAHDREVDLLAARFLTRGQAALVSYVALRTLLDPFERHFEQFPDDLAQLDALVTALKKHRDTPVQPQVQA